MSRNVTLVLLALVLADFAVLSGYALVQHGYWGIWAHQFQNSAGWQVLADLIIVCGLAMTWMIADARRKGRTVWPYLLATLALGSFGPLLYLLVGALRERSDSPRHTPVYG
ncbi:MAG: DUF2834 domain-containing protein [Solimonas sp.]